MSNDSSIKATIIHEMKTILSENGKDIRNLFNLDTEIFDTGIDSLGFAVLVARLERSLRYDPFADMADAIYPKTLGEFISIYEDHNALHK